VFAVCIAAAALYFWNRRYLKNKAAETDRVEAYKQEKAAASAIIYPIVGLILIAIMLFNWNRIPPENTGLAIGFIIFAALLISYGFFRWYKMGRSGYNQD
jgi:Na+/H+ antiporter NhaC